MQLVTLYCLRSSILAYSKLSLLPIKFCIPKVVFKIFEGFNAEEVLEVGRRQEHHIAAMGVFRKGVLRA